MIRPDGAEPSWRSRPHPTKLRWGILGCAGSRRRGLIPGIRDSATGTLQALASRDRRDGRAWAGEFRSLGPTARYEELLADPEVDAVYIPLPNELHKPWVEAAADAGKHVLCEKPLALDAAEAARWSSTAGRADVVLMEAFMWRHQPRTAELRRLVAEGAIGELRLIRSSFSFPIDPGDWRLDPGARRRGALGRRLLRREHGPTLRGLRARGDPRPWPRFGPTGVDLSPGRDPALSRRRPGLIDCSFEQPFRCVYELVGTEGSIEVPDAYLPPSRPFVRIRSPTVSRDIYYDGQDQYGQMVDAFARAARPAHRLPEFAEDGLAQMIVLDGILAAARGS